MDEESYSKVVEQPSMEKCKEIVQLLRRILNNEYPPTDEEMYLSAKGLSSKSTSSDIAKAIEILEKIIQNAERNIDFESQISQNEKELNNLGKFQWVYKEINLPEEIGLWYTNEINGRTTSDWFYETDTEEEIQEKLRSIKAEENCWRNLPKYK